MCLPLRLLLTSTFLLVSPALLPAAPSAEKALQNELIAADRSVWEAVSGAHPRMEQVDAALAPDYLDIDGGEVHSRKQVFDFLKTLTNFSFHYNSSHAYLLGPAAGYVVSELSYQSTDNGKPVSGRVLTTTVFSKENGKWRAHLHTEMEPKSKQP